MRVCTAGFPRIVGRGRDGCRLVTPEQLAAHPDVRRMVRYQARRALYGRCLPITVGDLETDALTRIWQDAMKHPDEKRSWMAWAWNSARWAILDRIDSERTRNRILGGPPLDESLAEAPDDPEQNAVAKCDAYRALASLTPVQARRVSQTYWWGMSSEEIAQAEGIASSSVRASIGLAMRCMRRELDGESRLDTDEQGNLRWRGQYVTPEEAGRRKAESEAVAGELMRAVAG